MEKEIKSKYWCFNCSKECQINTSIDNDVGCAVCKSTFIEEITEENKPQNFVPLRPQINIPMQPQVQSTSQLLFLPNTVHCVRMNVNSLMNTNFFTNNLQNVFNQINQMFQNNNLFTITTGNFSNNNLLNFLNVHNNDQQFENLLNFIMLHDPNRYGNPPASQKAINELKRIEINEENIDQYKDLTCNVCLSYFELNEKIIQMKCYHEFHEECLLSWLKIHNTCPICRDELESEDPDYENRKRLNRETLRNYNTIHRNGGNGSNGTGEGTDV